MAKKTAPEPAPLIQKLEMNPESDTAQWVQQQYEAGVKDQDILTSMANAGSITPAKFKRVRIDDDE